MVLSGLFFLQPSFKSGRVSVMPRALADSSPVQACYPSLHPDVDFRWAFVVESIKDGKRITRPVRQDMVLTSGDRLKMMVDLQKRCYVYLFHEDARNGMTLLFPYTLEQFADYYKPGRKYDIPRAGWFQLDNHTGREMFYLVASARRLKGLEKAWVHYESAKGDAKPEAQKTLQALIEKLGTKGPQLCSPAERPVTIGGALRSVKDVRDPNRMHIATFADEIVSSGLTTRTYTIEHQ